MSNPVIEQMLRHVSVRNFKPEAVPPALIETIVAAGQRAATSSNLQLYSVVAVTDAATRQRLSTLCGDQEQIREAPVFLAWCADRRRLERACELRGYTQDNEYLESFLVAAVDVALLMQNAALAAESLGLGMCYIGAIRNNPQAVIDLLHLPPLVFPISGMTLGWPNAQPPLRPRLPLPAVLHWERYDDSALEPLLAEYDQAMAATGIYSGRQVPAPGKPGVMEDYGWTEHSARRVREPQRTGLRAVVERQGFGLK